MHTAAASPSAGMLQVVCGLTLLEAGACRRPLGSSKMVFFKLLFRHVAVFRGIAAVPEQPDAWEGPPAASVALPWSRRYTGKDVYKDTIRSLLAAQKTKSSVPRLTLGGQRCTPAASLCTAARLWLAPATVAACL